MMFKHAPFARLASQDFQSEYIINTDKTRYALPEDLLEDAASYCLLLKKKNLPERELDAVEKLHKTLKAFQLDETITGVELVKSQNWQNLLSETIACLAILGINDKDEIKKIAFSKTAF